jgi:replicative DNA helicase
MGEIASFSAAKSAQANHFDTIVDETALLAALMVKPEHRSLAGLHVSSHEFSRKLNAKIFDAIGKLVDQGTPVNPLTVSRELKGYPDMEHGELRHFLVRLGVDGLIACSQAAVVDFATHIRKMSKREQAAEIAEIMASDPSLASRPLSELSAAFGRMSESLSDTGPTGPKLIGDSITSVLTQVEAAYQAGGKVTGVSTGISELDHIIGGLAPSDLCIIGGRPSMGKTALAITIGVNAASAGHKTLVLSLEMSADQLVYRILAGETGIPTDRMQRGDVHPLDIERLMEAQRKLGIWPLSIEDKGGLKIGEVRAIAEQKKRAGGLDLIVVDYLQLIYPDRNRESRVVDVTEVSAGLKTMAKALNVPVVALAQLSRGVEGRDDKKPQLSDLRDSGAIEQDADQVLFVYRDEYYLSRREPSPDDPKAGEWARRSAEAKGKAQIIVAKNRHGRIGDAHVKFDAVRQRFEGYGGH